MLTITDDVVREHILSNYFRLDLPPVEQSDLRVVAVQHHEGEHDRTP